MADRKARGRQKVVPIAAVRIERLLDRIAERHRANPERLAAFIEEQVAAEKGRGLSDEVRKAIEASGLSLYAISQETGVSQAQLSRFMRGERSLTLETADKLAKVLKLKLMRAKTPRRKR